VQVRTDLAVTLHFPGRLADGLDHQRDGALVAVEVGDGQRDAFALGVRHHDHELARPGGLGHPWMADLEQVSDVREVLARDDLVLGGGSRHVHQLHLCGAAVNGTPWSASTSHGGWPQ